MYIDPTRYTTRPTDDRIPQELAIYDRLEALSIPYVRVDHDRADTIEICHEVERILGAVLDTGLVCSFECVEYDPTRDPEGRDLDTLMGILRTVADRLR